ncbi:type IV pilus modification protein PilV [Delftia sp. RIT313]|uniref:type IV pilus modification protein PilV n=1 Tax=Delftia sp. RIT313 TaxID=1468410 RepID=UPI0004473704|nr:type IV pilus modification protein PilV [Delftia sp. RIT313]EZP63671.1 Type IV pilus modification protein PilV [Delftia sp. RIT313]
MKFAHAMTRRTHEGVTLIEMMVALIIMSIGLLGLAGLQAATTKYRITTMSRAAGTGLVFDLSERIRINADAAGPSFMQSGSEVASLYTIASDWTAQQKDSFSVSKNCNTAACTSSERATFDLLTWRQKVRDSMPQGGAMLSGNKRDGITVTLMWFDKEFTDGSSDATLQKAPTCNADQSGMARQTCCPAEAKAVEGVRCSRFSFVP